MVVGVVGEVESWEAGLLVGVHASTFPQASWWGVANILAPFGPSIFFIFEHLRCIVCNQFLQILVLVSKA